MTTYVASSVVLRHVLRQPDSLDLAGIDPAVSSILTLVECQRTLDRLRLRGAFTLAEQLRRLDAAQRFLGSFDLVEIDSATVRRAGEPIPVPLTTLDALHLSTALFWREEHAEPISIATHDHALADAARAYGFPVLGA